MKINTLWQLIGLQTPKSRLIVILFLHVALLAISYDFLEASRLSLYDRIGIPSPSIGLTRAYWFLLHGNLPAAIDKNTLILLAAPVIWTITILDILKIIKTPDKKLTSMLQ